MELLRHPGDDQPPPRVVLVVEVPQPAGDVLRVPAQESHAHPPRVGRAARDDGLAVLRRVDELEEGVLVEEAGGVAGVQVGGGGGQGGVLLRVLVPVEIRLQ